jgi:hypothetical protein
LSLWGIEASDLKAVFTSPRDGKAFVIRYNGGDSSSVDAV